MAITTSSCSAKAEHPRLTRVTKAGPPAARRESHAFAWDDVVLAHPARITPARIDS
jgi:hypothetical protein